MFPKKANVQAVFHGFHGNIITKRFSFNLSSLENNDRYQSSIKTN